MFADKINISDRVSNQLPEFIRDEDQQLVNFLFEYYKSQEKTGRAYNVLNNLLEYLDIDAYDPKILTSNTILIKDVDTSVEKIEVEQIDGFLPKDGSVMIDNEVIYYQETVRGPDAILTPGISLEEFNKKRQNLESPITLFDGVKTTFDLKFLGTPVSPVSAEHLVVTVYGTMMQPVVDYTISGSQIVFTTPPRAKTGTDQTEFTQIMWDTPNNILDRWSKHEIKVAPPVVTLLMEIERTLERKGRDMVKAAQDISERLPGRRSILFAYGVEVVPVKTATLPPADHTNCYLVGDPEGEFIDSPGYQIGGDRISLKLEENDEKLIQELSKFNKNLVVVYVGGSAIDMNNWQDKVPSILFSWYSGMEGGKALAKILYGDINPSGKLPFSIPKNISDYPYFNPFTDTITYGYYHGYTLFEKFGKEMSYPFGFGLSYSKFHYKNLIVSELNISDSTYQISFDIENISNYNGKEVAQLYVGFNESKVDRPVKLLRGFKKISIPSKEIKNVSFKLNINDLSWYNPEKKKWEIEKIKYKILVGSSSRNNDLIHSYISLE